MIKIVEGDIINLLKDRKIDLIVHGCNCQGNMGKGLAKSIKNHFPKAAKIDEKGELPGTICSVMYPNGSIIVNAYTQIYYGKANSKNKSLSPVNNYEEELYDTQENRYDFIRSCLKEVKKYFYDKRIGLPKIGCGLAGGDWDIVNKIIEEELSDCTVTIVEFIVK